MNQKRAEKERKELNKKLIKATFKSEWSSRKKVIFLSYIIDVIAIFFALKIADFIIGLLAIDFWLVDFAIKAAFIIAILQISSCILRGAFKSN